MHRLLKNKGNVLLVTVIGAMIILMGFSMLTLLAAHVSKVREDVDEIYQKYTYESYGKIIADEVIKSLADAEASVQYSPLKSNKEIEALIQSALINTYIDSSSQWIFNNPFPTEVTHVKLKCDVTVTGFKNILNDELDLFTNHRLEYTPITIKVAIDNTQTQVTFDNINIDFVFSSNKICCRFDTSKAKVKSVTFTPNTKQYVR